MDTCLRPRRSCTRRHQKCNRLGQFGGEHQAVVAGPTVTSVCPATRTTASPFLPRSEGLRCVRCSDCCVWIREGRVWSIPAESPARIELSRCSGNWAGDHAGSQTELHAEANDEPEFKLDAFGSSGPASPESAGRRLLRRVPLASKFQLRNARRPVRCPVQPAKLARAVSVPLVRRPALTRGSVPYRPSK